MQLTDVEKLAGQLFKSHDLEGWHFKFDNAVKRFGLCNYRDRTISLSRHLVQLNPEPVVTNTLLHEIAHALVGAGHGHNRVWVRRALSIGCDGQRCYSRSEVKAPELPYKLTCPACGRVAARARRPAASLACGRCCAGKYNRAFIFIVTKA